MTCDFIRVSALVPLLLLAGCGYIVAAPTDVTYEALQITEHRGEIARYTAYEQRESSYIPNRERALAELAKARPCTIEFLLSHWGEPDVRASGEAGSAKLTYYQGFKWVGATPVMILPLPLFIPAGRQRVIFGVNENMIVSIDHETVVRHGVYLPLWMEHDIIGGRLFSVDSSAGCTFVSPNKPCSGESACARKGS